MKKAKLITLSTMAATLTVMAGTCVAAHPKWSLTCDSEDKCVYLSDGNGGKQSAGNEYPVLLNLEKLEITVPGDDPSKCTWQWKYVTGTWRWVCILSPGVTPPGK